MNTKLVESLVQIITSLTEEERNLLEKELFWGNSYPSTQEVMHLAEVGGLFNFLNDEPDIYTLEDGEPV